MIIRRVSLAAAVLLLLLPAGALAARLEKGVKAGLNLASFRGDYAELVGPDMKPGFVGGAFVAIPFSPSFAVRVEALYSMKGAKEKSQLNDTAGNPIGTSNDSWDFRYLEIPLLVRANLAPAAKVQPFLCAGPSLGISLGGTFRSGFPGIPDYDFSDDLKPADLGVALGGGVRIGMNRWALLDELRWTTGLSDLYDLEGNLDFINSVFSFTLGAGF